MSETLTALETIAGAVTGSGLVGAISGYLAGRRRDKREAREARAEEREGDAETDRAALPHVLARLTNLEKRDDENRTRLDECERGRGEWRQAAQDCERKLARLGEELGEVRRDQELLRASTSQPPPAWKADGP